MKSLRLIPETVLLYLMYGFFSLLPAAAASNLGGFIARFLGPKLGASRKARAHLKLAFPDKSAAEIETIVIAMWDNLGRVFAEYPHLETIARNRVRVTGNEIVARVMAEGQGGIFFSAHLGNWEIFGPAMLARHNTRVHLTYRAMNNPAADSLLRRARTLGGKIPAIPKARTSAKDLMGAMKNKNHIGILLDQKYNEGILTDFFGRPAMTNPVAVALARKYKAPLIPVHNIRTGPAQFDIVVGEPISLYALDGSPLPQEKILQQTQSIIESWVRQNPAQWIWLHRRWMPAKTS